LLRRDIPAKGKRTADNGLLSEEIVNQRNGIIIALALIDL
jgi:hypothetical protein